MHLGLRLNLFRSAEARVPVDLVMAAERAGFHSVWTAEAYGADALTPLAWVAAHTSRIRLGTSVAQLAARPATTLGMTALTIDGLAGGGRVILGVGLSGPQIVEGWYGQPWGRPNARLRDYLAILRQTLDREGPVSHDGPELSLPYRGPGALGQGKPLTSILHAAARIPVWVAAGGQRNTALAAEVADGWLPMGLTPAMLADYRPALAEGAARRDPGLPGAFDVFTGCVVVVSDDVQGVLDGMRPMAGMYVGGMGSATHNYHRQAMERRGFPEAAARIQELWLAGRKREAVAAVPDEYLEQTALIGSPQRVRARFTEQYLGSATPEVTGVIVTADSVEVIEMLADLCGTRDELVGGGA